MAKKKKETLIQKVSRFLPSYSGEMDMQELANLIELEPGFAEAWEKSMNEYRFKKGLFEIKRDQADLAELDKIFQRTLSGWKISEQKLSRGGKRNRISPQEKKFKELLPELDLNRDWITIWAKLSDLDLEISKRTLQKFIKKYRAR